MDIATRSLTADVSKCCGLKSMTASEVEGANDELGGEQRGKLVISADAYVCGFDHAAVTMLAAKLLHGQ